MPVMAPVVALIPSPGGSPAADHVYGVVPPVALTDAAYARPTNPEGSEAVVMFTDPTIVMLRLAVLVTATGNVESETVTITVFEAAPVGVPLIAPDPGFRLSPSGRPCAAHVCGAVPTVATSVAL